MHIKILVSFGLFNMDSKNIGRRRNFTSSQTTKLSKLSIHKKANNTEETETIPTLFDSPFLLKSCRYIDISSTESECSKEIKAKTLLSNNELSDDLQNLQSGNCIIETSKASCFEDGRIVEDQVRTSKVIEKEKVTCNIVSDKKSENILKTNCTINESVDSCEQNRTSFLTNKNNSEVSQLPESVTFDVPNFDLNLYCDGQHKNEELKLKKEDETVVIETSLEVDFNLSPKDINISACPLCWKKFEKKSTLFSHMKICASSNNVSTRQLLNALDLQNKQAAERKAIGLPAVPVNAPPRKSSSTRKNTYNTKDPNLELALALSVSMQEAKDLEIQKETDVLLEAGLEDEAMEKQKSLLERFGFTSSKSPVLESIGTRPQLGSKKFRGIDPVLLTRSQEERERLITEKVAIILMDEDCSSNQKQYTNKTDLELNSKLLKKLQDVEKTHWQISYASEEVERSEFYVKSLHNTFPVCSIASGSKLKLLTEIPCREKTPERQKINSKCDDDSVDCVKYSETQLFEFVDDLNKYSETKNSKNTEIESSTCKFQDTENLAPMSSFHQKNNNLYFKELLIDWERMINNEMMSDVTIYIKNERKLHGHKLVFYARCSQILDDITQLNETGGEIIFWDCVSYDSAIAFLSYLYCGDVKRIASLQEHLPDIKYLAVKYNITELLNIFKNTTNDRDIDINLQSFEGQKQNIKETSDCILANDNTCDTKTRFYRSQTSSKNELNLENSMIQDTYEDSITVPKSPDLFEDQKVFDMENDKESPRRFSKEAVETKSDLDFLASMLSKSTPPSVSIMSRKETENCEVDFSAGEHLISCESDSFNLHCTPDKELRCNAKRYLEEDNSCNEYRSGSKKVCIEGELGPDSSGVVEAANYDDLVDLTQTSSDENDDNNCNEDNEDSANKQVTISELSQKCADNDILEMEGLDSDKMLNQKLCEKELVVVSKYDSPDKIVDYKPDETSKVNISSVEDFNAELDLFGYDEYDHFYNNDLSDRSPIQSPENSPQVTENESENQLSNTASDENEVFQLSQNVIRVHENIKESPSLNENGHEQIFKSPSIPSKQNIPSETRNSLVALLDDSFSENLANTSLICQATPSHSDVVNAEKIFSPNLRNDPGKNKKKFNVPEESEQQNTTPDNSKLNYSPNVTPIPDYSGMKTPLLKKELNKYGLKDLKRRQAKLILRHIYNELHPLVPVENVPDELCVPKITEQKVNKKHMINSGTISSVPKSPVKRNLLKNIDEGRQMETELNTLSDSESSGSASSENELDVGDDKIFVEGEELASQEEGSVIYDLPRLCQEFIQNNPELYQKILLYEPIWLNELFTNLKCLVPKLKLNSLMDYLDEQCITFRTSSQRQRRKNRSPSKKKRVAAKAGKTSKSKKNDNSNNS